MSVTLYYTALCKLSLVVIEVGRRCIVGRLAGSLRQIGNFCEENYLVPLLSANALTRDRFVQDHRVATLNSTEDRSV